MCACVCVWGGGEYVCVYVGEVFAHVCLSVVCELLL